MKKKCTYRNCVRTESSDWNCVCVCVLMFLVSLSHSVTVPTIVLSVREKGRPTLASLPFFFSIHSSFLHPKEKLMVFYFFHSHYFFSTDFIYFVLLFFFSSSSSLALCTVCIGCFTLLFLCRFFSFIHSFWFHCEGNIKLNLLLPLVNAIDVYMCVFLCFFLFERRFLVSAFL